MNASVTATFSKAMDPATLSITTFTLKQGATAVPGVVTYAGTTATLAPASSMAPNVVLTARITVGSKDAAGRPLAADYTWSFTTRAAEGSVAPVVVSTDPANAATGVATDATINATFSKAMARATLDSQTFSVRRGAAPVTGVVTYSGMTATFTPSSALIESSRYTVTISTGAKDATNLPMLAAHTWTFTTVGTAPLVVSTDPTDTQIDVLAGATVKATFSTPMAPATINGTTFTLTRGSTPVSGVVTYAGTTATFTPGSPLVQGARHTARVSAGSQDLANNRPLAADYLWTFTTAAAPGNAPMVVSTNPAHLATSVSINMRPTATFSREMDPLTITDLTFTLKQGLTSLPGHVSYDAANRTATFEPDSPLGLNLEYTATVTTGVRSAGTAMANDHVWRFTTSACSQLPVVLGAAFDFVVLAGSTVTNTGPTSVTGDLGLSPGSAVEGFPPGNVVGTQHVTDTAAAAAALHLTDAYNDAAGRTLCPVSVAGNLGGQTLTPGLYKSTDGLEITSGDLTLDALGDPEGVFIFQMASTLVTTAGRQVILSGGAKSANVFWQVGTSATLDTTTAFQGTIMADQSITMNTLATLNGRVLARIGAVNLDSSTIVKPAP